MNYPNEIKQFYIQASANRRYWGPLQQPLKLFRECACSHGRKSGGGGGGTGGRVPPRFFRWGTEYQMSPPRFVGTMKIGTFLCIFFYFFACQIFFGCAPGKVPLQIVRRRWRSPPKKCRSPPPPPPPPPCLSAFLGLACYLRRVCICPPHNPIRICAPACSTSSWNFDEPQKAIIVKCAIRTVYDQHPRLEVRTFFSLLLSTLKLLAEHFSFLFLFFLSPQRLVIIVDGRYTYPIM